MTQDIKNMTHEEAQKEIGALVAQAYELINKAKAIANEHKLSFGFNVAYGMGGRYEGDPDERSEYDEDGWHSSSQSC